MLTILTRELLVSFRRGTPHALITANALVLACLAAAIAAISATVSPWVAPPIGATSTPTPTSLISTLVGWRGPGLFLLLSAWLALLSAFVAPAAGARTVTAERGDATLDLLVGSGVKPLALVAGKWLGACAQVVLVLASGAPAFALAWLFGGVPLRTALLTVGVLVALAALLVSVGMLAAALVRGELLPTALGAFIASLLFFATAAAFVAGALGGPPGLVRAGVANPLLALVATNGELADTLGKTLGLPAPGLPLRLTASLAGRDLTAPLTLVVGFLYAGVAVLLLPLVAMLLEPYHHLKTGRLRRAAARS
jgi:ABC-type transport system involved in multi-copper enzyme maturation permease subunit